MSAERVPKHGKADVAFAGAELRDAWFLIGAVFAGLALGGTFGWVAYLGFPLLGYCGTKAYIDWKSRHLPGYCAARLYRCGVSGYSRAFDRQKKRFVGDGRVINPDALRLGAIVRTEAGIAAYGAGTPAEAAGAPVEDGENPLAD